MALWAVEKSNRRVTVERRGSRPDSTISIGLDVIVLNVEAWERNTRLNSLPSKMAPMSMGCLQLCRELVATLVPPGIGPFNGGLQAEANQARLLRNRVVNRLRELDPLPLKLPLPFHCLSPSGPVEPGPDPLEPRHQADRCHNRVHGDDLSDQNPFLIDPEAAARLCCQGQRRVQGRHHRNRGETDPDRCA